MVSGLELRTVLCRQAKGTRITGSKAGIVNEKRSDAKMMQGRAVPCPT